MKYIATALVAAISTAAAATPTTDAQAIIKANVLDPGSVQFRGLKTVKGNVCGEYNAKNSFGGYVGFKFFAYKPAVGRVYAANPSLDQSIVMEKSKVLASVDGDAAGPDELRVQSDVMLAVFSCNFDNLR